MASQKINASLSQNQPNGVQILVSVTPDPRNSASIGNTVDKNMFVDIDLGSNYQGNINNASNHNNISTVNGSLDRPTEYGFVMTLDGRIFDNQDSQYEIPATPTSAFYYTAESINDVPDFTSTANAYDKQVTLLSISNAGTFVVNFGGLPTEVSR